MELGCFGYFKTIFNWWYSIINSISFIGSDFLLLQQNSKAIMILIPKDENCN
jgi:hypothetical protein